MGVATDSSHARIRELNQFSRLNSKPTDPECDATLRIGGAWSSIEKTGSTPECARGWNRSPLPSFPLRYYTPKPRKGEMRSGYKRFFPRGFFQQRESGGYHLSGTMVRRTDGFRIFKMKRMDDGVGNKKQALSVRCDFERHLAW